MLTIRDMQHSTNEKRSNLHVVKGSALMVLLSCRAKSAKDSASQAHKSAIHCRSDQQTGTNSRRAVLFGQIAQPTEKVLSCHMIHNARRIRSTNATRYIHPHPLPALARRCGSGRPSPWLRSSFWYSCSRAATRLMQQRRLMTPAPQRNPTRWHRLIQRRLHLLNPAWALTLTQRLQPNRLLSSNPAYFHCLTGGRSNASAFFASCSKAYPC